MDLLTRADLTSIAKPLPGDTHVSLFMPTHRFGRSIEADRLRWKNLVDGVETLLAERMRRPDWEALLAPARRLQDEAMEWQHMSDGLVMHVNSDGPRTFRVPAPMPSLATVGDRFVMGPTLRLLSGDQHFFVLTLSQRQIRLLEGGRNGLDEVQLGDVPTSLRDVVEPQDPRSDTMTRPVANAGRGGPAIFFGHGAGDRDFAKDEVLQFLRAVSSGLHDLLIGQTSPMVLLGLEHLVKAYEGINSYDHLAKDAVVHNPDQLSSAEVHQLVWPGVEERLRADRATVIEHFRELHGTGLVTSDLDTVAQAAAEGRVDTLFVKADPWCWERDSSTVLPIVDLGTQEQYAECELVDAAAIATMNNSGRVFATSEQVVPDSEVAAILRY
ncbi:MAG: hypothetical protein Q4P07_11035 [Ornithinimicrobium sp.]|uniref:baeRF3 domain-containing protein n=1 Tax=Ornithinimicrobium sp. TaxID=1977084 RepID=UPI0026E1127C|nr:hypothetical protein [Ornithinimicrobium sp.]MDO5740668.1 hypothetical protein [Ornithinimicrobium sp.]